MNTETKNIHEEDYFRKRDVELWVKLLERAQIKENGVEDEQLVNSLISAGFNHDSMRAILLLPLVHTAWADGEIQRDERHEILSILEERGFPADSEAYQLIALWLQRPPTDARFIRAMELLGPVIREAKTKARDNIDWIFKASRRVAEATGCALHKIGLRGKISPQEDQVIRKMEELIQPKRNP